MTADAGGAARQAGVQRLDKWLWFARIVKSRTLAAHLITAGKIRVNRVKADKPSQLVKPGDVITSSFQRTTRVLRILDLGARRGPAAEAQRLYEELTLSPAVTKGRSLEGGSLAPSPSGVAKVGARPAGAGRPTKRDRRRIDKLKLKSGV